MKTTAILSAVAVLGLSVQSAIAVPTNAPTKLPTQATVNPNNVRLAVTVSGKITLNGVVNECKNVKVSLTSQPAGGFPSQFKADAKVTQLSPKECAFTIVAPKESLGKTGYINVDYPVGTYFIPGNWKNPISIPTTGKVENINGTIKIIG
jgi:hypothetical protein